jgi:hypothetical protein
MVKAFSEEITCLIGDLAGFRRDFSGNARLLIRDGGGTGRYLGCLLSRRRG